MLTLPDEFLQAILASPDDDAIRLILADWLEERGDGDRAEFVRAQVEIAATEGYQGERYCAAANGLLRVGVADCVKCRPCCLRRREWGLLAEHGTEWIRPLAEIVGLERWGWAGVTCGPNDPRQHWGWKYRRGFVYEMRCHLADWIGAICPDCEGDPPRLDFMGIASLASSVCQRCQGRGRVGGHGPALVRAAPIETVRVSDREPYLMGNRMFCWRLANKEALLEDVLAYSAELLPWEVYWCLPGSLGAYMTEYPTPAAAHAALSAGLLKWAKEQPC